MKKYTIGAVLIFILTAFASHAQTTRYVKEGGTGDGSSWASASGDIQEMINAAAAGDQIWVAKGKYYPNRRGDALTTITLKYRNNSYVIKKDVKLYGGFAGNETALASRNVAGNATILSGDYNDDDIITGSGTTLSIINNTTNAYHVIISAGDVGSAVIDGFTITGANANGGSSTIDVNGIPQNRDAGGAIRISQSAPKIANCTIVGNAATHGAGIVNVGANPVIENCTIDRNLAEWQGGGITNWGGSSPTITNVSFTGNSSRFGSGMLNDAGSSPAITNCSFASNGANDSADPREGGAMTNWGQSKPVINNSTFTGNKSNFGGAILNHNSSPRFFNCQFTNNTSRNEGGAIQNWEFSKPFISKCIFTGNESNSGGALLSFKSSPVISNSLFYNNKAAGNGGAISNYLDSKGTLVNVTIVNNTPNALDAASDGMLNVFNSILWGGVNSTGYVAKYSLLEGVNNTDNGNIEASGITKESIFKDAANNDFSLAANSPALNKGANSLYDADVYTKMDILGNSRIRNNAIDLGAYEFQAGNNVTNPTYKDITGVIKYDSLTVRWTSLFEKDCEKYEIQISEDNVNFKTYATVITKAAGGNSLTPINYETVIDMRGAGLITAGSIMMLLLSLGFYKKKKVVFAILMVIAASAIVAGCTKRDPITILKKYNKDFYVRIVQFNKSGENIASDVVLVKAP